MNTNSPSPSSAAARHVFLSSASVWEAVIKHALGKLPLPAPPAEYLPRQRKSHQIQSLSIDESTVTHVAALPPIHRDPFDRILIAQSLQYGLTLASVDSFVRDYSVALLPMV